MKGRYAAAICGAALYAIVNKDGFQDNLRYKADMRHLFYIISTFVFLTPILSFAQIVPEISQEAVPQISPEAKTSSTSLACDIAEGEHCYDIALETHYGTDRPKDKDMAHRTFAKLCEGGLSKACHAAAIEISRYSESPDFQKSIYFQSLGCDSGTSISCFVMGRNFEAPWDKSIEPDHDKARAYFTRGCDLGMGLSCGYAEVKATGYRLK